MILLNGSPDLDDSTLWVFSVTSYFGSESKFIQIKIGTPSKYSSPRLRSPGHNYRISEFNPALIKALTEPLPTPPRPSAGSISEAPVPRVSSRACATPTGLGLRASPCGLVPCGCHLEIFPF